MIKKFVEIWDKRKSQVESVFRAKHPGSYKDIVEAVVGILTDDDDYFDSPDKTRIHQIDDGDYQGTLLFVIASSDYQPSNYWYVKVGYGSCSGCDTLQAINDYCDETPNDDQVSQYMTLALHVLQGLKSMQCDCEEV